MRRLVSTVCFLAFAVMIPGLDVDPQKENYIQFKNGKEIVHIADREATDEQAWLHQDFGT